MARGQTVALASIAGLLAGCWILAGTEGSAAGNSIDFGAGPLPLGGEADNDVFVVFYDADGDLVSGSVFPGFRYAEAHGVAFDADGNLLVSGNFGGTMEYLGTRTSAGLQDGFIFALTETGTPLWWISLGDAADQYLNRMVPFGSEMLVTGSAFGTLPSPGAGDLVAQQRDMLLLRFRP